MFRKSSTQVEVTVIGRGAVIEGKVRGSGRFQVEGQIVGSLEVQGAVSIGPGGRVEGELITDELAVGGHVEGKISVRGHLHVLAGGHVQGEARYASLQIDRGGVLDGRAMQGEEGGAVVSLRPPALELVGAPPPLPAPRESAVS